MFKPKKYYKINTFENEDIKLPKLSRFKVKSTFNLPILPKAQVLLSTKTIVSTSLILIGIYLMILKVFIPAFVIHASSGDAQPIISPLVNENQEILSVKKISNSFTFDELEKEFQIVDGKPTDVDFFYLTIPKLEIKDALVEVNADTFDPKDAIGHYKGSCLPNESCNSFIFGHSTYKWKKNKYQEGDYTGVFSSLDKLEYGDEFYINYDGKEFRYIVELTKVASPDEIDPLGSPLPRSLGEHESTVELFTCTPSGTTKYRLSVIGKLVK